MIERNPPPPGDGVRVRLATSRKMSPPYDWEAGASNNQRLEFVFLEHTYRWLKLQ